jgi:hypothetical protein
MLCHLALVRADVSEELSAFIRVIRIGELGTFAVTSNRHMLQRNTKCANIPSSPVLVILMTEALSSCETLVLTGATGSNIPESGIHYDVNKK